ncbi:MAG: sulfotransferase family protein [Actinomycetes bacterium]
MEWRHTLWPEIRMVYTATPKVANTSVKSTLLQSFHPEAPRRNPHAEMLPYLEVHPTAIARRYPDFLHFAVARDPFDRFVSFFEDRVKGTGFTERIQRLGFDPTMGFTEAAELASTISDRRADPHLRSQSFLLTDRRGRLRPHLVLRFERMSQDWRLLCALAEQQTGHKPGPLPHRRVSERRDIASYYDDETLGLVAERFRTDFELLGYPTRPLVTSESATEDADPAGHALLQALAAGGSTVLDLSAPSRSRAVAVEAGGGYYLGVVSGSAVGQLTDVRVLKDGRVPDSAFDVLVVNGRDARLFGTYRWLRARFASSGRTVITV